MTKESKHYQSCEFRKSYQALVKKDTWDKGLPMVYRNDKGELVRHWKDGKIEIVWPSEKPSRKERICKILAVIIFTFISLWICISLWTSLMLGN